MDVDLLIKNIDVFNSYFKKFVKAHVSILNGKFLYIGINEAYKLCPAKVIDGKGKYLVPGLVDVHMHIESSMATPMSFSNELIKNGVTTVVSEPHEIANVFGIEGVKEMINAAKECVVDIFYGVPSSVPSTSSKLETTGDEIGLKELKELLNEKKIICLGEVMNYMDVINDPNSKSISFIQYVKNNYPNHAIEGHCPKLIGLDLAKFIFYGVDSDHTQHSVSEIKERILNGMFIEIQEKTLTKDIIEFIIENELYEHVALVTDDVMADSLVNKGHLNKLVKKAISLGMKPENAIYIATFTPSRRMKLSDKGSVAPGKCADFILLNDLEKFSISHTFKDGIEVYNKDKEYVIKENKFTFPAKFYESVHLSKIEKEALQIKVNKEKLKVKCRIMEVKDTTTFTREIFDELNVVDGIVDWVNSPYCLIAVFERHGKSKNVALGLVTGDTIKHGSVATTYAHDHHNLLVIGKNPDDMVRAANAVIQNQGGYCVVNSGQVLAEIELPIAGILSDCSMDEIGQKVGKVRMAMEKLGYNHYNPIMSLSTMSLPVSPELKITDMGLIRVSEGKIVDVIIE
ncbi:amidohydrolase family protein [Clostridium bowmanii]|uniref:adenine deaminase C-terminal domain-containing protein n=1 Tax=Clostridium bowmanii TaxID=132925 RepID=UPI001C0BA8C4|nr:adenine deaminase C-terminal domain-containing protein [Clostridium bowmanii]MBU3191523.1 amidohydrolase family protein [Clostridium bowmanii]MCA1075878.1 amidohydrolase family protein [Clostridium bowmanii]